MPSTFKAYGSEPDFHSHPREALAVNWHKLPSMNGFPSPSQKQIADTSPPHSAFSRTLFHAMELLQANDAKIQPSHFRKELFFFYGSLMDPTTLRKALNLKERPKLQPATVTGYHCKIWASYPALVYGPPGAKVHGAAFEVQSAERVTRLQNYETKRYEMTPCQIELGDGLSIKGKTFVWHSSVEELHKGRFDLTDFQMRKLEEFNGEWNF